MKLFMILFNLVGFVFIGAAAFKTYAYLTERKFRLTKKKLVACFFAGAVIDSLSEIFRADVMLLQEHLFYSIISALVFAVLLSCLFAFVTVKREEAAAKKQLKIMRARKYTADISVYRPDYHLCKRAV